MSGLYRLSIAERIDELGRRGVLSPESCTALRQGRHVLSREAADRIIENVIGVFGLPFAIAPNFIVNGRERIVPMVVEEPSIVAAVSDAARLARATGGFFANCKESLLAGQVHVTSLPDVDAALEALAAARDELVAFADSIHPRLQTRGGGVRSIDWRQLALADATPLIAVDILVDTCDAMGANLVNTICEAIAPRIAELSGGSIALRILSNLNDRAVVTASVRYRAADLATADAGAVSVRDGIVLASDIAAADPYRAATHNKGVMNGIDAVALATGNDWRAVEAGAHAWAALDGYRPLTTWSTNANGDLVGELSIPLKVGIVGGTLKANPGAQIGIDIAGVESARELAELMAAVGLAQNFAALRALATAGIQKGHMRLHARSVAAAAGVPEALSDAVVERLIDEGDIKEWRAREVLATLAKPATAVPQQAASAAGKVILLGEHGVVYGRHALAVPIVDAVRAWVETGCQGLSVSIPEWGEGHEMPAARAAAGGIDRIVALITERLDIAQSGYRITLRPALPRGMGLGSSAAVAVALIRAFARTLDRQLEDEDVNALAFECEKLAHETPSGVDNTIATYARPMLYRNDGTLEVERLVPPEPLPLVVAWGDEAGLTKQQVRAVRTRRERLRTHYEALFDEMDDVSVAGAEALRRGDYARLGALMNVCHGLLNAIEVSTPALESMVAVARSGGALGAKLTGAGGGGSIVALCPGSAGDVSAALEAAGFRTLEVEPNEGNGGA